ncbi:hypothetical protein LIER_02312 [Lithospermum erythrorhizon]|uniref:DUF4408 domain-containing protein n=1 Tax=Lithospermum erythrorhizon TaxID=34254 RepID=A0AAV3NTP0_LITER
MNMFFEICSQYLETKKVMHREMFDNVNYEKAKAMARFNMFQKMKSLHQVLELLVLLVVITWSIKKIPTVTEFSCKLLIKLVVYLQKPLVVFVIVNLIMLALFVLSKQNYVENDHLYDEYALCNNTLSKFVTPVTEKLHEFASLEVNEKEMQIVAYNEQCDAIEAIEEAMKKIRRFERTQSEKLKRQIYVRPGKELRRSETENCRLVVRHRIRERRILRPTFNKMDQLSNEEFKLAIDDFINQHRVLFKQKE